MENKTAYFCMQLLPYAPETPCGKALHCHVIYCITSRIVDIYIAAYVLKRQLPVDLIADWFQ